MKKIIIAVGVVSFLISVVTAEEIMKRDKGKIEVYKLSEVYDGVPEEVPTDYALDIMRGNIRMGYPHDTVLKSDYQFSIPVIRTDTVKTEVFYFLNGKWTGPLLPLEQKQPPIEDWNVTMFAVIMPGCAILLLSILRLFKDETPKLSIIYVLSGVSVLIGTFMGSFYKIEILNPLLAVAIWISVGAAALAMNSFSSVNGASALYIVWSSAYFATWDNYKISAEYFFFLILICCYAYLITVIIEKIFELFGPKAIINHL